MIALRQFRPWLVFAWASVGPAAAAPALQALTSVVNVAVPASAYDPATAQAEVTLVRGLVLQITSSTSWKLRLRALRSTFTYNGRSDPKRTSDLQLRDATSTVRVPTTSFVQIANGGNTHGAKEYAFDVILQTTGDDAGGLYSVQLEFDLR